MIDDGTYLILPEIPAESIPAAQEDSLAELRASLADLEADGLGDSLMASDCRRYIRILEEARRKGV